MPTSAGTLVRQAVKLIADQGYSLSGWGRPRVPVLAADVQGLRPEQ